ncbi:MAG: type VI secretion system protein ImpH [Lentimonas sp.]|jgi:type VI secretion system protein ImpH
METEDRLESDLVKEVICDHPVGFDFFRLMSLLEVREGQPLGTTSSPKYERFRLAQEISLNFPPSSIASADYDEDHDRINVIIRCLGMLGANGVLPTVLTEYIERRVRSKRDKTLYAFINLLQHRLFTLFYRAWALNQPCIDYAWGDASRQRNRIAALAGVHDLHEEHACRIEPRAFMYYCGIFSAYTANRDDLIAFLEDYFKVPFKLIEFVGNWLVISKEDRAQLGRVSNTTTLGVNLVLGERIWNAHLRYRLHIGPVDHDDFLRFLPNHPSFYKLRDSLLKYVGSQYDCTLSMTLRAESVPSISLGKKSFLGWNTWLGKRQQTTDANNFAILINNYSQTHYGLN